MDPEALRKLLTLLAWARDYALETGPPDDQVAGELAEMIDRVRADAARQQRMARELIDAKKDGQELFERNLWLHEVIVRAAQDLEHLGNAKGRSEEAKRVLLGRAARMRHQAQARSPRGWTGQGSPGSDRRDEEE